MIGNKERLLTTKEVADLLNVSDMTVKRWSDKGLLSCKRVGIARYRYYLKDEVMALKDSLIQYNSKNASMNIEARQKEPIKEMIEPSSHPAHYLMHKYWGRKAHNVIAEYIKHFTAEGETVLDPFMGSGVTVIEAVKNNRNVIGNDLNPISTFIVNNTLSKVNLTKFHEEYLKIQSNIKNKYGSFYTTKCPICGEDCSFEVAVWEEDTLKRLKGYCSKHGKFKKDADVFDIQQVERYRKLFNRLHKENKLNIPKDKILKYVKRSKKEYINELFSERALIILSDLLNEINKVKDEKVKNLLLFCFSSMLPNVSKMLPGDLDDVMYKSGWVISKFWVPKVHTERNIFNCFENRFETILKGKTELLNINSELAKIYNADAGNLFFIENESIDYVFTDPPYGESIAYFALSHFWNSWLKNSVDYKKEIIIDPYRQKDSLDFKNLINRAFKEINRVLKPGKYLSFTFHSRDLNIWKIILESVLSNGFQLVNIVMQPQAVSSGTQGINRKNTLKGDFIYNFVKMGKPEKIEFEYMKDAEIFIVEKAKDFIEKNDGVSSSKLYEYIIPLIVNNHAYLDNNGKVINIEKLFKNNFRYQKIRNEYLWLTNDLFENVKNNNKNVLDLFSGAGGFSAGFANAGYNIVAAVEYDPQICKTYRENHKKTFVFNDDIRNISSNDIKEIFEKKHVSCDIIIGGPPCQGFSMSGKRIRKNKTFINDPRNRLFQEYYRIVKDLRPKVFVIENVEGILTYNDGAVKQEIIELFSNLGYDIKARLLNAADYGVPQLRKRAFFIGNNLGLDSEVFFPKPTHNKDNYVTVWEAISDLPKLDSGEGKDVDVHQNFDNLTKYQKIMRDNEILLYNHVASNHKKETLEKIKLIDVGMTQIDLPEEFRTKSVHSGSYGRMEKNKPAYTLTTRINTPSVGRVIHPEQHRTITPREAARIQSFKDSYRFIGNITSLGIQIGNAVPPLLAEKIAERITFVLDNKETFLKKYPSKKIYQQTIFDFGV